MKYVVNEGGSFSMASSWGLPSYAVAQFCFTMSNISYQSRLACFWKLSIICTKGLAMGAFVVGCLPSRPKLLTASEHWMYRAKASE